MAIDYWDQRTKSRCITILPNEKRIIYRKNRPENSGDSKIYEVYGVDSSGSNEWCNKTDSNADVNDAVKDIIEFLVSGVETEYNLLIENDNLNDMAPFFETNVEFSKRAIVLERLRRVRFNKFVTNKSGENASGQPLSSTPSTSTSNARPSNTGAVQSVCSFMTGIKRPLPLEKPNANKKKSPGQCPEFYSGDMINLEPGEVPSTNYVPINSAARVLPVYCVVYPCPPELMKVPFNLYNYVNLYESSDESDENSESPSVPASFSLETCHPSKAITELFQRAKEKAESGINISDENLANYNQSVFPSFPSTAESDAQKMNQKEKRRLGRLYRVKFSNDVAMLRHHANRWIRGGRLSTTGKFIEAADDDNDDGHVGLKSTTFAKGAEKFTDDASNEIFVLKNDISEENLEIFEQLCKECPLVSIPPKKKVDVHVIYEDTHRYDEYNRYWNELHGCSAPKDDVEQAWQRKWYQYYNYVINFIDIPDDLDDNNDYQGNALPEKMELYYQQWRWKQVQQFNGNSNVSNTKIDQRSKVWSDGVSFAGEPVVYEESSKQSQ